MKDIYRITKMIAVIELAIREQHPEEMEQLRILRAYKAGKLISWKPKRDSRWRDRFDSETDFSSGLAFLFKFYDYRIAEEHPACTNVEVMCEGKRTTISRDSAKSLNLI